MPAQHRTEIITRTPTQTGAVSSRKDTHSAEAPSCTPRLPGPAVSCRPSSPYPASTASGSFSVENHFFPGLTRLLYNRHRLGVAAAPDLAWSTVRQSRRPAGLLLRLLLISSNARSGCLSIPKLPSQAGHRVWKQGLPRRHVPGLYLLFFFL